MNTTVGHTDVIDNAYIREAHGSGRVADYMASICADMNGREQDFNITKDTSKSIG